ncbi:MAG: hypothetical protein PHT84_04905 [Candidatus Pacebacteria bacterium]|nr:hypothetical protein [Candidatus Paceibacterota bacterium]
MINLKNFYQQTERRYKKREINLDSEEIKTFIDNLYQQAKQNYSKLPNPKFCSQKAYIILWINQEISKDIARKSLKSFDINQPPDNFKAVAEFYKSYPPQSFSKFKTKESNNLNDKTQKWLAVVKERNQFSFNKGYKSRLDMYFDDFHIPQSEYKKFLKNVNKVINFCKKQIYSKWNPKPNQNLDNYCLVCNFNIFPFKKINDFLIFFERKNKFYKKNKNKIKIEFTNESRTEYIGENDTFKITINKNTHINHQIIELIHEFGHVETMAKIFNQDKFIQPKAYFLEKLAIKKEVNFLKKYYPKVLIAREGNILRMVYQTLFEIEIYQNPNENPNKIYLKYLKKCSQNTTQSDSWNYLSNQDILYKCFTQLIYAISYTNILNNLITDPPK